MPAKGTSLIIATLIPVKNPPYPSLRLIFLIASAIEEYSENPITSNLVFITIKGLQRTDYRTLARTDDDEFKRCSFQTKGDKRDFVCSKAQKQIPALNVFFMRDGVNPRQNPLNPSDD